VTLREITRRPKKALARRSDIDNEPMVQVQRLDTRMGSGLLFVRIKILIFSIVTNKIKLILNDLSTLRPVSLTDTILCVFHHHTVC